MDGEGGERVKFSMSNISFREAVFLSALPYRKALFSSGGWIRDVNPHSKDWNTFLRCFFSLEDITKARKKANSYPSEMSLSLGKWRTPVEYFSFWEDAYPERLRYIYDPPPVLFYGGIPHFSSQNYCLAVVGTRRAHPVSRLAISHFLSTIKDSSLVIISGFALGVDAIAHHIAIQKALPNIAVLGAGLFHAGPQRNLYLLEMAQKKQLPFCLLSEFSPLERAQPYYFPRRNRIIAGLSDTVLVIQAPLKSGALITASYALEEGRNLIFFDDEIFDDYPNSNAGARIFLQEGAEKFSFNQTQRKSLLSFLRNSFERINFQEDFDY